MFNLTNKQIFIALAIFFSIIVCMIVGFEINHKLSMQKIAEQQALAISQNAQQIETLKAQTDRLSEEANRLSQESATFKRQVDDERLAAEKMAKDLNQAASLVNGFQLSMGVKTAITSYYAEQNAFPKSNADIGVGESDSFKSSTLKSLSVSKGGVITLTYDEKTGVDNGTIRLTPSANNMQIINWKCSSPNYENIAKIFSSCTYEN